MLSKRRILGPVMLLLALSATATELSRPAGLEPDIHFWTRIFSEIPSQQMLVHDNRRLDIVYARVDLPHSNDYRAKRRLSEQARKKYKTILKTLARGKRDGLTSEQARVLALWGADTEAAEFRRAADRIRTQQGLADGFRAGLSRSTRWEAHILSSLRAAGVPEQLASLPHVESSYNPEARSHVGAAGLWQFTQSTGRRFMQIDHVIDERRDPYRSSEAAAALLKYNYSILQSWPLAITAYNHGVAGMRRAVKKTGTDDIETIVRTYKGRSFGFASRNFYVAFLAANDVVENADEYFGTIDKQRADAGVVVTMPAYFSTDTLADAFGVSLQTLRQYNPALLDSVWSGLKYVPKGFALRLPSDELSAPPVGLLAAVPDDQRFGRQTPDLEHKVRRGDSLSTIAVRYDTTVAEIMTVNNLKSRHRIRSGQILNLPFKGVANRTAISSEAETYTVRAGDTLSEIAQRSGVGEPELLAYNELSNGHRIYVGQKLRLKAARVAAAPVTPEAIARRPVPAESAPPAQPIPAPVAVVAASELAPEPELAALSSDATTEPGADTEMLADPTDYLVAADGTIEIQAEETLGHYASWLNIRTQQLRNINGYAFRNPAVIGRRLKLDFTRVTAEQFSAKRVAYHRELQETFFTRYRIADTKVHEFRRGDSLFVLSLRRYKVPVWLLRQYNPELDLDRIPPGTQIVIPQIVRVDSSAVDDQANGDRSNSDA